MVVLLTNNPLTIILSIILFLVALGILVAIHEFGHLIAAKSFGVYCSEYSIGFGPKIIKFKGRSKETQYSIGVLPFGGYVAMYGEGTVIDENLEISRKRSLEGIKRWKRLIIMAAGVTTNFILAFIIFFICDSCFPQYKVNYVNVISTYKNENYKTDPKLVTTNGGTIPFELDGKKVLTGVNLTTYDAEGKEQYKMPFVFKSYDAVNKKYNDSYISYYDETDEVTKYFVVGIKSQIDSIYSLEDYSNILVIYPAEQYDTKYVVKDGESEKEVSDKLYLPKVKDNQISTYSLSEEMNFTDLEVSLKDIDDETNATLTTAYLRLTNKNQKNKIDNLNFGVDYTKYWNGWNSFKAAGEDWVESTTIISRTLVGLFAGKGWNNVGGAISIFTQTTSILENNPFNYYLQTWGIISVNLALFNLLPFPGLDGWQILVTVLEGAVNIFKRKKYNNDHRDVDKEQLLKIEDLQLDIEENEKIYESVLEKKYNHEELKAKFEVEEPERADETGKELKYYTREKERVLALENYQTENNLENVQPFKEWKIPEKVKGIISTVGLIILFAFIVLILIKDIIKLF
ncbi:MAG: site-2 protease family protein [Bacilli bacterium]|nr:site-2 protease family protein [Bacilli bacterium]